jgi:hypothetical protein
MLAQGLWTEGWLVRKVWGRESRGGEWLSCCLCFLSDLALIPGWGYLLFRNRLDLESTIFNNANLFLTCNSIATDSQPAKRLHQVRLCTFASGLHVLCTKKFPA